MNLNRFAILNGKMAWKRTFVKKNDKRIEKSDATCVCVVQTMLGDFFFCFVFTKLNTFPINSLIKSRKMGKSSFYWERCFK